MTSTGFSDTEYFLDGLQSIEENDTLDLVPGGEGDHTFSVQRTADHNVHVTTLTILIYDGLPALNLIVNGTDVHPCIVEEEGHVTCEVVIQGYHVPDFMMVELQLAVN